VSTAAAPNASLTNSEQFLVHSDIVEHIERHSVALVPVESTMKTMRDITMHNSSCSASSRQRYTMVSDDSLFPHFCLSIARSGTCNFTSSLLKFPASSNTSSSHLPLRLPYTLGLQGQTLWNSTTTHTTTYLISTRLAIHSTSSTTALAPSSSLPLSPDLTWVPLYSNPSLFFPTCGKTLLLTSL